MSKMGHNIVGKRTSDGGRIMLTRKIEKDIHNWIEDDKRALLVYGVRQAGKTYIIRKCLKEAGCKYVEFNLIREPEIVSILETSSTIDDLMLKLSLYSNEKIIPGETILFFDEIQKYKEIVTKIKFLVEDGRCRYVLSGSLLGVEIVNLKSAPVGSLRMMKMYPLDFEEFLQVFHINDDVIDLLRNAYESHTAVDRLIHEKFLQIFNLYLIIGGMPAAVEKYRQTESIDAVMEEHLSILEQYKLDFTQYEAADKKLLLSNIYELIPAELNEKNKRFKIADIDKNLRFERMEGSFSWLWKAGVALPVFNTTEPTIPLMINKKSSLFKLFLSDVGMLTTIYGKAAKLMIVNNEKDINKGAIYENVIAQELIAHGYAGYYYCSKRQGELDFIIEHRGKALPIEVKSGKDYKKHSALQNILQNEHYHIEDSIVFSHGNVEKAGRITYLPMYMIMFLEEKTFDFVDISIAKFKF